MVRVGIVGSTGLVGEGLIRILAAHPEADIRVLTSRHAAGRDIADELPALAGLVSHELVAPDAKALAAECDVVFLAMKSAESMRIVPELLEAGVRCIDIGGEFRFRDPKIYEKWYGNTHEAPALCAEAVWGLPEQNREKIKAARLVGNPGCYPTSAVLAALPLIRAGLVDPEGVIVNSISGVSGAGRTYSPKSENTFLVCYENVRAYGVGTHKHAPEIDQALAEAAGQEVRVTFVPHLAPIDRGILTQVYLQPAGEATEEALRGAVAGFAATEPFVRARDSAGEVRTAAVRATNFCDVAVTLVNSDDERSATVIATSAIDNTVKGAGGQAVQNMNIMFGLDERAGLDRPGM
ncbi:MAG: N-acetyl-gamma-glutamyl-phosphate reductase [Planctomycetota bacterium]|jgi:N-acetyl-gamma-glutamyl-phosphate reductase